MTMSIHVWMYIYIYIYGWVGVCVWVSVCVFRWVAKEGILSSTSLTSVRVSRETPLSTLARRPHKEMCSWKPASLEEKNEDSQLRVRPQSGQSKVEGQTFQKLGVRLQSGQLGVRLWSMESRQSSEDNEEMSQHIWLLCGIFAEFSRWPHIDIYRSA